MPSPFPGMDPYIESSDWYSFHTHFSVEIARQLVPRLRPKYFVRSQKQYILTMPDADDLITVSAARRVPDVSVTESGVGEGIKSSPAAALAAPLEMATLMPESVPQVTVEIYDVAQRKRVTAIEILSPVNKRGDGRDQYLAKRQRILLSGAHLMEIDLLRSGERVPMAQPLPAAPYFVFLSRVERRPISEVWPITIRTPLPKVPVPLLPGDPDVALDLQAAFTAVYDGFGYDLELDYAKLPAVALDGADAEWARKIASSNP